MEQGTIRTLIETAIRQLEFAYTPYSHFKVGAALLAEGRQWVSSRELLPAYLRMPQAERELKAKLKNREETK